MTIFRLLNKQPYEAPTECGFFMEYEDAINERVRLELLLEKFEAQLAADHSKFYEDTQEVHWMTRLFEIEEIEVK